jgi:hypothetical protein
MATNYFDHSMNKWAKAISIRISDEWQGNTKESKHDVIILQRVLENSLRKNPDDCKKLIGTTIIEEDYFDKIF